MQFFWIKDILKHLYKIALSEIKLAFCFKAIYFKRKYHLLNCKDLKQKN